MEVAELSCTSGEQWVLGGFFSGNEIDFLSIFKLIILFSLMINFLFYFNNVIYRSQIKKMPTYEGKTFILHVNVAEVIKFVIVY